MGNGFFFAVIIFYSFLGSYYFNVIIHMIHVVEDVPQTNNFFRGNLHHVRRSDFVHGDDYGINGNDIIPVDAVFTVTVHIAHIFYDHFIIVTL